MDLQSPFNWSFSSGKSAGVCVDDNQFYKADPSDLAQPFSDAFVTFEVSSNGIAGSGVIPYLPEKWFNSSNVFDRARFSSIWFKNFISSVGNPPENKNHNYFHLIGSSDQSDNYGLSNALYDYSYIFIISHRNDCGINELKCIRETVAHEMGHLFKTNWCTNLQDCVDPTKYRGMHDYREWWLYGGQGCTSAHPCLMDPIRLNVEDGIDRFCKEDLLLGDPNCAGNPGQRDGAIRTVEDPQ